MLVTNTKKMYMVRIAVLILAIVTYYVVPGIHDFILLGVNYFTSRNFVGLRELILSYGLWAPIVSIILMTIQSIIPFVPGLFVTIANAWIFGWQYGAIYSWIGALLGAFLDFCIARWYGRPIVECFVSDRYICMTDQFLKRHGSIAVFITRLTPIIPFKMVSYGAGLTTMPLSQFIIATGIGQTPAIVIYSVLAHNLIHNAQHGIWITVLLMGVSFFVFYYRHSIERYIMSEKE